MQLCGRTEYGLPSFVETQSPTAVSPLMPTPDPLQRQGLQDLVFVSPTVPSAPSVNHVKLSAPSFSPWGKRAQLGYTRTTG